MKRIFLVLTAVVISLAGYAQTSESGYFVGKNFVSYNDSLMSTADVQSFQTMKHGYAKDKNYVYYMGKVLKYADPTTFSLTENTVPTDEADAEKPKSTGSSNAKKEDPSQSEKPSLLDIVLGTDEGVNKYAIEGTVVSYDGKVIKKADAASFKYIGGEYAADKHHAYYQGRILGDAWGVGQFTYKGNGYATDGVHWYCNGKPVDRD